MPLSVVDTWADGHVGRQRLAFAVLFLSALALLSVGVWEHTSVTGKDEYYLGLRTPMCMVEQDEWLVPCLDGAPRLKKPPMLYWLTRGSYELFGVSLGSARLVAVSLASLLVLGVALIARESGQRLGSALLAGLITLSFVGLFVSGRMLELDVPVAAFSTLAFLFLMRWYRRRRNTELIGAALLLAAGFLTKGPIVLVVAGAGGLALLAMDAGARNHLRRHWAAFGGTLLLFAALALPWFYYVGQAYPEQSARELSSELADRRFLQLSPVPLYGILMLALPWSFILLERLYGLRALSRSSRRQALQLALWLALTLLPFFFIRTFERYLFGSLVPLALLLAYGMQQRPWEKAWAARLGLGVTLVLALPLILLAAWLGGSLPALVLGLGTLGWFLHQWWQARHPLSMTLSAILLWVAVLGVVYPRLGINQIPQSVVETARSMPSVFYHGPQPGLLPAVLGRSLRHLDGRWRLPTELQRPCSEFLLFTPAADSSAALKGIIKLGLRADPPTRFGVLSSRVSWNRMARRGITAAELWAAIRSRELEPIKPQVHMYRIKDVQCPAP